VADWYYIGHYGQLGPLSREQLDELIDGGVISRETYIWSTGMTEWLPAERVTELRSVFATSQPYATPPPPPAMPRIPHSQNSPIRPPMADPHFGGSAYQNAYPGLRSDRNRTLAGILQLILPGVGRIYLGYAAFGVLQLIFTLCGGLGYLWSIIDGIIILTGGVKLDGYGRQLAE